MREEIEHVLQVFWSVFSFDEKERRRIGLSENRSVLVEGVVWAKEIRISDQILPDFANAPELE